MAVHVKGNRKAAVVETKRKGNAFGTQATPPAPAKYSQEDLERLLICLPDASVRTIASISSAKFLCWYRHILKQLYRDAGCIYGHYRALLTEFEGHYLDKADRWYLLDELLACDQIKATSVQIIVGRLTGKEEEQ